MRDGDAVVWQLSGLRSPPPRSKTVAEAREQVDRELDAVLAKLDALDSSSGKRPPMAAGRGAVVSDVAFTTVPGKGPKGGKSVSWRDYDEDEGEDSEEEEDQFLPKAFKRGKQATEPPSRRLLSRRDDDDDDDDEDREDRDEELSMARMLDSEELEDDRAASMMIHSKLWGSGQETDDAYLDPEETPGQFFDDEVEEAIEMGIPIKDMGKQPGFMFEGPAAAQEEERAGGARRTGPTYAGSRGPVSDVDMFAAADWSAADDDDDLTADLDDRDLEKLDKMFAEEAKKMGSSRGGGGDIDWGAIMGAAADGDDDDLLGLSLLDEELRGLEGFGAGGRAGKGSTGGAGKAKPGKAAASGTRGKKAAAGGGAAFEKMKVAELKEELKRRGLPVSGTKSELVARLQAEP